MLSLIVAIAQNNAIGKGNDLLWHLSDDLKHFKRTTSGHPIIMGRKTFESFGSRPLPKRTNIIITRQVDYQASGCVVVHSLAEALAAVPKNDEAFIIGGGEIYRQALPDVDKMHITIVHHDFDADTWFPDYLPEQWTETESTFHPADEKHAYPFTIKTLVRKE